MLYANPHPHSPSRPPFMKSLLFLAEKYQKLVHNRCARCNLCNLNNADVGNVDIVDNIDIKLEQSYFDSFSNMDTIVSQSDETH